MPKEPKNKSYAASYVKLESFVDLENCSNVKGALIYGNHVIVDKNAKIGDEGLFFPVETQLSEDFVANNNLYRKPEWGNKDPNVKAYFEQSRRVKAVRFRGHKSEGFFIPSSSLNYLNFVSMHGIQSEHEKLEVGDLFDELGGHEICRKYIPRGYNNKQFVGQPKQAKLEDSIVEGQFRLHTDTDQLRRNIHKIKRNDVISISDKWHGTSVVIAKILVKRKLNIIEKLLKWTGVQVVESLYGLTYSSRKVIKAVNGQTKNANHFYSSDIWGTVAKEVEPRLLNGFTLYGEIVGFTEDGAPIQGGYSYGCGPKQHKFLVYRVTHTNVDGKVIELSWPQMTEFCQKYGFELVPTLYYGTVRDLFLTHLVPADWPDDRDFHDQLLKLLEEKYVYDQDCIYNPGKPAEGVVVRIDHLEEAEAFKLKSFRFLNLESIELDKGILDMETAESEEDNEQNIDV